MKKTIVPILFLLSLFLVSCSGGGDDAGGDENSGDSDNPVVDAGGDENSGDSDNLAADAGGTCGDGKVQRSTLEDCGDLPTCDALITSGCCEIMEGANEFCDDGKDSNGTYGFCKTDCSGLGKHCGDGEITDGEFCDDGKDLNGTSGHCNADCLGVCGDGKATGGEFCDDGKDLNGTSGHCASNCETLTTPYLDSATNLTWSSKSGAPMWQNEAAPYCENLKEGEFDDWRLPTISELRTLIRNCPATVADGNCKVNDECLSYDDCWTNPCGGCDSDFNGKYSLLGDSDWLWSSSPVDGGDSDAAWHVGFCYGGLYDHYDSNSVRCVR